MPPPPPPTMIPPYAPSTPLLKTPVAICILFPTQNTCSYIMKQMQPPPPPTTQNACSYMN